jgi:hypothetical protein
MNGTKLTVPALIVVGFAVGILIGYLIRIKGPSCVDQPPTAAFVVSYNDYNPPSLKAFYDQVAVGPNTNAVFRRDMVLFGPNGQCSVPPQLANVGGTWCPGDPCNASPGSVVRPRAMMGQQVTQRVGYKSLQALKEALDAISSSPSTPSP